MRQGDAGVAHPVERHLAKVEVASSSLVTRSINPSIRMGFHFALDCFIGGFFDEDYAEHPGSGRCSGNDARSGDWQPVPEERTLNTQMPVPKGTGIFSFPAAAILPSPVGKVSSIARRMGGAKHNPLPAPGRRGRRPLRIRFVGDGLPDIPVCEANNRRRWFLWLSLWESCHQR